MSNQNEKYDQYDIAAKTDFKLWGKLLKYALRYKKPLVLAAGCMMLTATVDAIYPLLTRYAIDNILITGDRTTLPVFAAFAIIISAMQGLFVYGFIRGCGALESRMCHDLRDEAFCHLQELSFSFYDTMPVGHILSRMVSDISRLSEMIAWSLVDVFWALAYIVASLTSLFSLSTKLALIVIAVMPVIAVVSSYFQKRILRLQRVVRHTNSRIINAYNEGISGAMTTKTLVREQANYDEFTAITDEMLHNSVRSAVMSNIFFPVVMFLGNFGTAAAIYFGGNMAAVGAIGLGTLAAFISYSGQLFDPIQSLARIFAELQTAQAAAERVIGLLNTPSDIQEKPEVVEIFGDNFTPKKENWPEIKGDICFRNVSFKYKNGETVLKDFNLDIKAGQSIALVGETGAGKSTIVNLACRFYEPTEGEILIDGVDYRERSSLWLESGLGYVLQSPHLFSGTIADNIRYGKKDATMDEVKAAAAMVRADEFIERFKDGYNTQVGEGGALLSTGQKQLISFARVVLADPRIIVLDEATSSIDTETEALIQHAINTVLSGRTSFIVAHRLSTIRNADRILVIDKGQIREEGSHDELMQLGGYYYNLYSNQFKREQEDASIRM